MTVTYSVSDARRNLPKLIRDAEIGEETHITRRGETVAVILGRRDYDRLKSGPGGFMQAVREFRESLDPEDLDFDLDEFLEGLRDPSPGRDISFD